MRAHLFAAAAVTAAVFSLAACESDDSVGSSESNITEWATTRTRDKAYTTQYVIKAACQEIYGAGPAATSCESDHEFRLVESKYSTKYGYLKAIEDDIKAPLEVGQTLAVEAPEGHTYEVKLLRQLDEHFHLRWTVLDVASEGGGLPPIDVHDHIQEVADDLGEYVDLGNSEDAEYTSWDSLPDHIQLECESVMLQRAEWNSEGGSCTGSADYMEDGFGRILFQGQTVGYICGIEDVLYNCPLHDGSGIWLFMDTEGTVVTETEWTG
jgi:hypothetical protein